MENFILSCDVKFTDNPKANSGVFFRVNDLADPIYKGFEIQCGYPGTEYNSFGAIYSFAKPTKNVAKPNTEWNHVELKCDGPLISVKLNGELIASMDADKFDKAGLRPDGTEHKFKKMVVKDMPRKGYIGFQDHSTPVYFKNVKLLELK